MFNDSVDRIVSNSKNANELRTKGYDVEKSVVGRFGYLLVCQDMSLLAKHPDLLLAASKLDASEDLILAIEKGIKK